MRQIRRINRGGFGVVHEIEDDNGNRVARKAFDPQISEPEEREKLARRFAREVRIQSQIQHPNIMPILQFDLEASPPWFTMPLASLSFEEKIEQDRKTGNVDINAWQEILAAVEELHRLGYVHRDLKPANVLLVNSVWMLADFGLILPTSRDTTVLTSSRSAYGSQYYAAPEQASDFRNTPEQADIFALGCILQHCIDHYPIRIPFAQIRASGLYGPILEKCTESDPRKRFPNVTALRAALFELWQNSVFEQPPPEDADVLEAVLSNHDSVEAWRRLIAHIESLEQKHALLRGLGADAIARLSAVDEVL